ncbi:MAG: hypothetical protein WA705_15990 [Candidatus Ozemobacteraceae bacterium]
MTRKKKTASLSPLRTACPLSGKRYFDLSDDELRFRVKDDVFISDGFPIDDEIDLDNQPDKDLDLVRVRLGIAMQAKRDAEKESAIPGEHMEPCAARAKFSLICKECPHQGHISTPRDLAPAKGPPRELDNRPVIRYLPEKLSSIVGLAEDALLAAGESIYHRGTSLVRPVRSGASSVRGLERRGEGSLILQEVTRNYLFDRLDSIIRWERFDKRSNAWVSMTCPDKIPDYLLARSGKWKFPVLISIIEAPTLRRDGSILDSPGYDAETGLYFDPGATHFPSIPQEPTKKDALEAVQIFKDLLKGFPFEEEHDFSVALAAILTSLSRRCLRTAPMFAFRAPVMGSGKSLLADIVAMVATGRPATVIAPTEDPNEERKRVLAALLAGDAVVNLDNVAHVFGSDTLSAVLTTESYSDRILGKSSLVTVPTCVTWVSTGNNLQFAGDLTTRVLPCNLDPRCERPEKRHFDVNLHEAVPVMRPQLVKAALTILRAYAAIGRPAQNIEPYGRFEEWSDLVRASLVWAGCADPCLSRVALEEADPVRAQLRGVLTSWSRIFGKTTITVQELIENVHKETRVDLYNALAAIAPGKQTGELDATRLGKWIGKHAKRVQDGLRIEKMGERQHKTLFRVVSLTSAHWPERQTTKEIAQGVGEVREVREVNPATPCEVSVNSNVTLQADLVKTPHEPHEPHGDIPETLTAKAGTLIEDYGTEIRIPSKMHFVFDTFTENRL